MEKEEIVANELHHGKWGSRKMLHTGVYDLCVHRMYWFFTPYLYLPRIADM